ncbi:hypothetical protein [Burkholderia sp. LMG 21824]|uniref:hypothetical protein n=1 Tax=Burkholderia sp. LMG 21824 TaxID=3158172 RepID=UPI003C2D1555
MSSTERSALGQRILQYMRATREQHPTGFTSVMIADRLDVPKNVAASSLSQLFDRGCVSRERDPTFGRGVSYLYRYVTDSPPANTREKRQRPASGHATVGDMLILIPIGREAMQVSVEDARTLYRHLSMLFGRIK